MPSAFHRNVTPIVVCTATVLTAMSVSAHEVHEHRHDTGDVADLSVQDHLLRFRETGDDAYLDRAATLLPNLDDPSAVPEQLTDAARLAQAQHRFDLALNYLQRVLHLEPHSDEAWLLSASVHLVRGDADKAADACRQIRALPVTAIVTCQARAALARGDSSVAAQLKKLLDAPRAETLDAELAAWANSVVGDALAMANPDLAIRYYRRSLQLIENTQTRAALSDVLLAQNRLPEVVALTRDSSALPLHLRRLIAQRRMLHPNDQGKLQREVAAMDHRFRHWVADADWLHAREMARFYLDVLPQPALAARLARINVELQREAEDLNLLQRAAGERL